MLDLAWDELYRLVSVSTNGVESESYRYDAFGRRTATVNAEGTERHVWDGDHCLADVDERGGVIRAYLWGPGVDNLLAVRVGGRNYAALTDIQGTVCGYADERGEIAARWTYDAWGNVLSEEIAPGAGELRAVRYRFQGRERSAATWLVHFRARWYDPETGRWLSPDPIGLEGGLNLHAFCGNDPVNFLDSYGLSRVIISDKNGNRIILRNPTLDEFRSTVGEMPDKCIQNLTIYDHGASNVMSITGDEEGIYIAYDGRVLFDDTNQPFSELLSGKMTSSGVIYLSGCCTAYDGIFSKGDNICKTLSLEMPGVTVIGHIGVAFGNRFGDTWNIGIRRSYKKINSRFGFLTR